MGKVRAAALIVLVTVLRAPQVHAQIGSINTRFDSGLNWYVARPAGDSPVYPGFHGSLGLDIGLVRRVSTLIAGSIESYRHGAEQTRDNIFVARAGAMVTPLEFDTGVGWLEGSVGYARMFGNDRFALVGGLGYMAYYGRLGIGLFGRYTQIVVQDGDGMDVKALVFGVTASVALLSRPGAGHVTVASDAGSHDAPVDARVPAATPLPPMKMASVAAPEAKAEGTATQKEKPAEKPAEEKASPVSSQLDQALAEELMATSVPEPPVEPALPDADVDGVPDTLDKCAATTREFPVDPRGCPVLRERFSLPLVQFSPLSLRPKPQALAQLDELAGVLKQRPFLRVKIIAYVQRTDSRPDRVLQRLARQRAQVIQDILIDRGVPASRVSAVAGRKPDIDEVEFAVSGSVRGVFKRLIRSSHSGRPRLHP